MRPNITCLILAGGQGTRLFPLTQNRAKPAVRFGGNYRLIDIPISNALNSGIKEILIYTQYCSDGLHEHIERCFPASRIQPASIQTFYPKTTSDGQTDWYLGTADAIRKNKEHLKSLDTAYFLILSGDQLYTMDLNEMVDKGIQTGADLVIATLPVPKEDATRFGLMKLKENGLIEDFVEKPKEEKVLQAFEVKELNGQYLASMGIYLFKKEALLQLMEQKGDDFGKELIPLSVKTKKTFAYIYEGYWEDIGTIPSFYHANLALLAQENCLDTSDEKFPILGFQHALPHPIIRQSRVDCSLISPGAVVEAKEISRSIIGLNTHIDEGTVVENSIFLGGEMRGTKVGKDCLIRNAIIDEHCSIGNGVKLHNKNNMDHFDGDGIYIREGIMIVSSGTILPDGFEF